jgi:hypothetical protein
VPEPHQNNESREMEILNFVNNNPNSTKADVVRHMLGRSAVTTTHAILKDMIWVGKINIYKKNLQTHLLTINQGNDFNKIYFWLSRLEKNIDLMYEPAKKIVSMGDPDTMRKTHERLHVRELHDNFLGGYQQSMDNILEFLLLLASNKIEMEKDLIFLYSKIIKLKIKIDEQMFNFEAKGIEHKFLGSRSMIIGGLFDLERVKQDDIDYAKKKGIVIDPVIKSAKSTIMDFRKEFLSEYETKFK